MTDSTPVIQRFLEEIHRRSMWQVLGVYLGTSWGVLEVTGELIDRLILPESVFRAAIVLLAIGLPIMLATAYFEASRHRTKSAVEAKDGPKRRTWRRWFTWRNALLGGVAAFALLGIIAAAFLTSRALGVGFAAPLIAQGVLDDRDELLLVDFDNRTPDSLLARAVTEALRVDLSQSSALRLVDPKQVQPTLERMELDPHAAVNEGLAREVARRLGIKAYLAGAVDRLGEGYTVSVRLVSAETGENLIALRETADGAGDVIEAVDRLSRKLRARVGESLGSVNATPALPDVTTSSLAALERFAVGAQALRTGNRARAIRLLEEAVRLDTTFASAYRGLSVAHGNEGDLVRADRNAALARRYAERLPLRERYLAHAAYHSARGRRDSVAHYYERVLDAEPENIVAVNNLADTYEWMGRYQDALKLYRRAAAIDPDRSVVRINLASIGRTLGKPELADSAVAAMEAAGEPPGNTLPQRMGNAVYAGRDADLEELIQRGTRSSEIWERTLGLGSSAALLAKRGRLDAALAAADSATAGFDGEDFVTAGLIVRLSLLGTTIAAGMPAAAVARLERWNMTGKLSEAPLPHSLGLGLLANAYARAGRHDDAERILARADSLAKATEFHLPGTIENARAVLALGRGDAAAALTHVERAVEADFGQVRRDYRLTRALALEALGRHREAAQEWEALTSSKGLFWMDFLQYPALLPLAHERAGYAYLVAGDTDRALRHLGAFTEMWAHADPRLQPRVRAATAKIAEIQRERG